VVLWQPGVTVNDRATRTIIHEKMAAPSQLAAYTVPQSRKREEIVHRIYVSSPHLCSPKALLKTSERFSIFVPFVLILLMPVVLIDTAPAEDKWSDPLPRARSGSPDCGKDGWAPDQVDLVLGDLRLNIGSSTAKQRETDLNSAARRRLNWETGEGRSYIIPALEIVGFNLALNGAGRLFQGNQEEDGKKVYSSTLSTSWDHLAHGPLGIRQGRL
jgi:hypothetical protein